MLKQLYVREKKLDIYKDGVYMAVTPTQETKEKIQNYIEMNIQLECYNVDDLHCTLVYSKRKPDNLPITSSELYRGTFTNFSLFGDKNEYLVLEFKSPDLQNRNKDLVNTYGFISDFDTYKTHMTLSDKAQGFNYSELPPIIFELEFEKEYISPLNLDWKSNTI